VARKGTADLQKAKEAKQKKIAIVGLVLLLAIMAFQGPRMWKMFKGPEAAPPPPATTTASTPTNGGLALPPVTGGSPAPAAAAPDSATSDLGPAPAGGQLVSFTRFASKDPFVQQIDPSAPAAPSGGGSSAAGGSGGGGGGKASSSGGASAGGSKSASSSGGASAPGGLTKATLVVNGEREDVAVGGDFPKDGPFFTLVAVGPSSARIGIAGGSYASGEQTATVRKGKTLVLQNTADGTRYEIELVATS
jgi:hypothetical protein